MYYLEVVDLELGRPVFLLQLQHALRAFLVAESLRNEGVLAQSGNLAKKTSKTTKMERDEKRKANEREESHNNVQGAFA